jgi:hypothetical protein
MSEEIIEIDIKLESLDVLKFIYRMFFGKVNLIAKLSFLLIFTILSLVSLSEIIRVLSGKTDAISGVAYLPIILVCLFIFYIIFVIISSKINAKQIQIIFTQDEVKIINPTATTQISWENYSEIQETNKDIFLFSTNPSGSFPIPKRFFLNEAQLQNFRELVRDKLGEKAKLQND